MADRRGLNRAGLFLFRRVTGLLVLLWTATLAPAAPAPRPNILFILTDDEGWPTLSCYGNQKVATPHLDQLAAEGLRLTAAYVTPQCTPTRASFLTGQHTARNGMWHVIPWYGTPFGKVEEPAFVENLSREAFTFPKALRQAGYATGIVGKWHLTKNEDGNYQGLNPEAATYYGFDFAAPVVTPEVMNSDRGVRYLTDQAIGFIEQQRARPWFLYLAHHTIHDRVSAPDELVSEQLAKGAPAGGLYNATYLAALNHLDQQTGRLLAKLDELGLREKTIVVFMSDNGGVNKVYDVDPFTNGRGAPERLKVRDREFENTPLREGKGSPYEGGLRVPCLVHWPGLITPGSTMDAPVHIIDWAPTFLEIAGVTPPAEVKLDGVSLLPIFRGEMLEPRPLLWYMPLYDLRWAATPCAALRYGDWKLIEWFGDWFDAEGGYHGEPRVALYNLREDIGEKDDLAAPESVLADKLRRKLHAWLESVPAAVPGANPHYDPARAFLEVKARPVFSP